MIAPNDQLGGKPANPQDDYQNLISLLAVLSDAENQLKKLETELNDEFFELVDDKKDDFGKLQKIVTDAEAALEVIALRHPDWFEKKKTIKTPYGEVSLKDNPPKIVADNEEVSIALIEARGKRDKDFDSDLYLRKTTELNLATLSSLTDAELADLKLKRVQSTTFSAKAAKMDLGKAVQERAKSKEA